MKLGSLIKVIVAVLATVSFAVPAKAQTDPGSLERTIPQLETAPAEKPATVVAPALPSQPGARVAQTFILSAVIIEGATAFGSEELAQSFEPFLASPVGQAELEKVAQNITDRYRKAGFLLSYAVVPEQSVQSGIVHIKVVEGFIGNVLLVGNGRSAKAIQPLFAGLAAERPLRIQTLERAIGLGRDMPGVFISDVQISRSAQNPARHSLTVKVGANRFRALAYVDNRGTVEGARMRSYSSFNLASLAVPGDQLQVDLFAIPYEKFRYLYGQLRGSIPLHSNGLRLTASASYGDQFQRISGPNQLGKSRQLIAELSYPFVEKRAFSVAGHFQLADWKSWQERADVISQRDRFQVARAWLDVTRSGKIGFEGKLGVSRGLDLGSVTEDGDPLASRPFAGHDFTKLNATLRLSAQLSKKVRLRIDSAAQYADSPLLAAEEFSLGGSRIGRAFDFNELTGDHGIGAMAELGYRIGDANAQFKSLEIFTFVDGGGTFRRRSSPGLPKRQWLAGTGAGARLSVFGILWSAEIGIPLARSGADRGVRCFFSTTKTF